MTDQLDPQVNQQQAEIDKIREEFLKIRIAEAIVEALSLRIDELKDDLVEDFLDEDEEAEEIAQYLEDHKDAWDEVVFMAIQQLAETE